MGSAKMDLEERHFVLDASIGDSKPVKECIIGVGSDRIAFVFGKLECKRVAPSSAQ